MYCTSEDTFDPFICEWLYLCTLLEFRCGWYQWLGTQFFERCMKCVRPMLKHSQRIGTMTML